MSLDYVAEKYANAVRTLATGTDSIQERLRDAYLDTMGTTAHLEGVPEEIVTKIRHLEENLTRVDAQDGEGSVAATTRGLSDEEASEFAGVFCDVSFMLDHALSELPD